MNRMTAELQDWLDSTKTIETGTWNAETQRLENGRKYVISPAVNLIANWRMVTPEEDQDIEAMKTRFILNEMVRLAVSVLRDRQRLETEIEEISAYLLANSKIAELLATAETKHERLSERVDVLHKRLGDIIASPQLEDDAERAFLDAAEAKDEVERLRLIQNEKNRKEAIIELRKEDFVDLSDRLAKHLVVLAELGAVVIPDSHPYEFHALLHQGGRESALKEAQEEHDELDYILDREREEGEELDPEARKALERSRERAKRRVVELENLAKKRTGP